MGSELNGGPACESKAVLGSFVRESKGRAYQVAMRLCRNTVEAEDLVEETLARVLKHWPQYDPNRPLAPWLFTVMKHAYLDGKKCRARKREISLEILDDESSSWPASSEPSILDYLIQEETASLVREAFAGLKPAHQEVLLLLGMDGMAYEEIAASTGIPIGTVRSRIARGREDLRRRVEEVMP